MNRKDMGRNRFIYTCSLVFRIICIAAVAMNEHNVCGQVPDEITDKSFGLAKDEINIIQNVNHLDDFFEKLHQLKIDPKEKVNIIHIGDSHIQADYMTEVVRKNLQRDFGNAGRGLVVPCRVAGTNEPSNFRSSSSGMWTSKRIIYPLQSLPIGVGGITVQTTQPGATLSIRMNDPLYDYTFSKIALFLLKDSGSFDFSIRDTTGHEVGYIDPNRDEPFGNVSSIASLEEMNEVTVRCVKVNENQNHATLFGISLENGVPGILYHAIGVNGAKYSHYNQAAFFTKQTQALLPELFIISLGTNESIDYPYLDKTFFRQVDRLIESLKKYNPQAKFILITPPDAFRRKVRVNPGIQIIREQIIQYAVENGFAFWDMYKVTGGPGAALSWRKEGLLRPDGVHFTKEGYQYQGYLFYKAIIKGYSNYVLHRYP
jgi:lysophospholipase L1-like esterase